jgi:hypothetical protein
VFVASVLSGALLAAPIEALARLPGSLGVARMLQLTGTAPRGVLEAAPGAVKLPADARPAPAAAAGGAAAGKAPALSKRAAAASWASLPLIALALFFACTTGLFMVLREFNSNHVLLDEEQMDTAAFVREHIPPKAVILHNDIHITPSGTLAGRPSLVGYTGWTSSHGYAGWPDRDRDRRYILEHALKDSDQQAYTMLRRWGVRYIVSERVPEHHRPAEAAYKQALARREANPGDRTPLPRFDKDTYLDGQLKVIYRRGRYIVAEVQGYGFPPT